VCVWSAYLVLWLIFGVALPSVALPSGTKMLPTPGIEVLIGWPVTGVLLGLAGAVAAARAARPAVLAGSTPDNLRAP
jgi:hypothetical protein